MIELYDEIKQSKIAPKEPTNNKNIQVRSEERTNHGELGTSFTGRFKD